MNHKNHTTVEWIAKHCIKVYSINDIPDFLTSSADAKFSNPLLHVCTGRIVALIVNTYFIYDRIRKYNLPFC